MAAKIKPPGIGPTGSPGKLGKLSGAPSKLQQTQSPATAQHTKATDESPMIHAVQEVARQHQTGAIKTVQDAIHVVVDKIVELRFSHLNPITSQNMTQSIQQVLENDPHFILMIKKVLKQA